ncbi:MAG: Gfo/Idh/MocA family oxidoreductase [Cyanobacteria bacterium SIG30]|nr:Gfo/Idh/MocA family oxidoreductase [Cyanobacteria bacterium SIG30]
MEKKKFVAVVGCGVWGKNIVRNFYNLNALNTVCDLDVENLKKMKELYPEIKTTSCYDDVINDPDIKAICVVTPSHTHYNFAIKALEAGKHVYIEKPISTVYKEAYELNKVATEKNLVLMVGHLLLYHPAVNRLKMLVEQGVLGKIKYVQSDRLNVNYFANDRSVMWDLAPHDVSMVSHILGKEPTRILNATGCATRKENIFDITHLTLEYEDGIVAQISDSWITPQKHVSLLVRGEKMTAILDDTVADKKLRVYDNLSPNSNNIEVMDYLEIEPLKLECEHFIKCIEEGKTPRSNGENGLMTVKILEQAEEILLGEKRLELDKVDFAMSRLRQKCQTV